MQSLHVWLEEPPSMCPLVTLSLTQYPDVGRQLVEGGINVI